MVNQKTLDAIKKNPEYKKSFRDGFLKGNPFGDSLSKEEANKVIDFLLSDPDLLNKSEKDFNKAAAAALPEIDKKWKAFSKELRHWFDIDHQINYPSYTKLCNKQMSYMKLSLEIVS